MPVVGSKTINSVTYKLRDCVTNQLNTFTHIKLYSRGFSASSTTGSNIHYMKKKMYNYPDVSMFILLDFLQHEKLIFG